MYSNAIQKLWVVKWETVAGCYTRRRFPPFFLSLSLFLFWGAFQRVEFFRHVRIRLSFVSRLFVYEESHCAGEERI